MFVNNQDSCCRQALLELRGREHHEKFILSSKGPLKEAWGLGSVWVTCSRAYCGMHYNETATYQPIFLGDHKQPAQALSRVNHVKSFFLSCS